MEPVLFIMLLTTAALTEGKGSEAYMEAFVKQGQYDTMLDNYQRQLVRDEYLRTAIGNTALITQAVIERRITWRISFP